MRQLFRRSYRLNNSRSEPQPRRSGNQRFDETTGQIYTEVTTAIRSSDDRDWDRNSRLVAGPAYRSIEDCEENAKSWKQPGDLDEYHAYMDNVKNSKVRGLKGSRSLLDAAIECILQNISDITLEGIECLPLQIVRQLWHAVNKRCTKSFNTWRIFAKVLREGDVPTLEVLRYRHSITNPTSPLSTYTTPVTSISFDFLTSLSLTSEFSTGELYGLSRITNLGVLEIINTSQTSVMGVGDRLMRGWHMAALNDNAFRVLRIIRMWNFEELTNRSLAYLNGFPALAIYDVRGCGFYNFAGKASEIGWVPYSNKSMLEIIDAKCIEWNAQLNRDAQSSNSVERHSSLPLWDTASVRKIPRTEVTQFLTRGKSPVTKEVTVNSESIKLKAEETRSQHQKRARDKKLKYTENLHLRPRAPEPWDFKATTAFARIGELREDVDLSRAGVNIGKQAVVGEELVNSVPMVSLCLGSTQPLTSNMRDGGLIFVHIKSFGRDCLSELAQGENKRSDAPTMPRPVISGKREQTMVKRKKRRLDDVLGSFM